MILLLTRVTLPRALTYWHHVCCPFTFVFTSYECNYGRIEPTVLFLIDSSVHKPPFLIQKGLLRK